MHLLQSIAAVNAILLCLKRKWPQGCSLSQQQISKIMTRATLSPGGGFWESLPLVTWQQMILASSLPAFSLQGLLPPGGLLPSGMLIKSPAWNFSWQGPEKDQQFWVLFSSPRQANDPNRQAPTPLLCHCHPSRARAQWPCQPGGWKEGFVTRHDHVRSK